MKYAAYVQLDAKNSMVKKNRMPELFFCAIQNDDAELAVNYLKNSYGSLAVSIDMFDRFSNCITIFTNGYDHVPSAKAIKKNFEKYEKEGIEEMVKAGYLNDKQS